MDKTSNDKYRLRPFSLAIFLFWNKIIGLFTPYVFLLFDCVYTGVCMYVCMYESQRVLFF